MGLATGVVDGLRTGDLGGELPRILGAALVRTFAVWVLAGLVFALVGAVPRWAAAGWAVLVGTLLLTFVGALVHVNHWLMDLSPFTHLPDLPGDDLHWFPLICLTAVTAALCATGFLTLTRRDLT